MSANPNGLVVKIQQARSMIELAIRAGLVPMLHGSPAIGKSSIIKAIAKAYNLKLIDLRLSQCDPTDLLGFPRIDPITGRAGYVPMDTFPLRGDELPLHEDGSGKRYDGWLLFLDEMGSASKAVQAASYKVVLDRMVGNYHLHDSVAICAAGNLDTDNAITEEMSTALQSRLVHLHLVLDVKQWLDWAFAEGNIDHRITSYIQYKPDALFTFKPDHTDRTYAAPRTWEFMDRLIKTDGNVIKKELMPLYAGTISQGVASEFVIFTDVYASLLTVPQIVARPDTISVPDEPSILYALTGTISSHMNEKNADALLVFLKRMPVEFQIVGLKEVVRRNKPALQYPAVQKWVATSAIELF
jgi:MoxR-like ATPase